MYVLGQERLQAMQNTQQYNLLPEGPIRRMHDPERQLCSPAMPCQNPRNKSHIKGDKVGSHAGVRPSCGGLQSQPDAYVSTRLLQCMFWMRDAGRLDTGLLCVGRNLENARYALPSSLYTHAQCASRQLLLSVGSLIDR
jgi:hypothetical protein